MSDWKILKTPLARIDLIASWAYIGDRNSAAAYRFRVAAEETFISLARMPQAGEPYEVRNTSLSGLRCARVKRFRNYLIFYRPVENGIEVIRVLHAVRNIAAILEEQS